MSNYNDLITEESMAFDKQSDDRIDHGFVPDLRRLAQVDWFYNNVWREPEFVKIHWMPRINHIIDEAKAAGPDVLELGCGLGMLSLELARNGLNAVGVDLSPRSIEIAEHYKQENPFTEKFGSLEYRCCDINAMEFNKGQFNSVVFFRSLHHIPAWEELLEKVATTLKPGGKLILSEPVRSHFNRDSAQFAAVLRKVLPTWENFGEKLNMTWDDKAWEEAVDKIHKEYVLDDEHQQSPLDNSIDDSKKIINTVQRYFRIQEEQYSDAFIDKLIGGLRGENRYELAKFLKFLDGFMVQNNMLPPTSLELVAVKE